MSIDRTATFFYKLSTDGAECTHCRVLVEQLTAEKRHLSIAYASAVDALRQLLADGREMYALLAHTNTYVMLFSLSTTCLLGLGVFGC